MLNEEQIISGCSIDGANSVRVDSCFGSYRWFVYIPTPLLRDASWILILHCGTPEPPQRHLNCSFCWNLIHKTRNYLSDLCDLGYCANAGKCVRTYTEKGVICECTARYGGPRCKEPAASGKQKHREKAC